MSKLSVQMSPKLHMLILYLHSQQTIPSLPYHHIHYQRHHNVRIASSEQHLTPGVRNIRLPTHTTSSSQPHSLHAANMCRYMAARHLPCEHLHQWFARCFWARMFGHKRCQLESYPVWEYDELYRCPTCMAETRAELEEELARWKRT